MPKLAKKFNGRNKRVATSFDDQSITAKANKGTAQTLQESDSRLKDRGFSLPKPSNTSQIRPLLKYAQHVEPSGLFKLSPLASQVMLSDQAAAAASELVQLFLANPSLPI